MNNFEVLQGTAFGGVVTLSDALGNPIAGYTGSEPLAAEVWPGGDRSAAFSPAVAWVSGPAGTIRLTVSAAQTATLEAGRWMGVVILTDPVAGPVEAFSWTMDLLQAPANAAAGPTYCTFRDMLDQGGGWLRSLQGPDADEGFGRARARARAWLDAMIVSRWQGATYGGTDITSGMFGLYGTAADVWIQSQLDAGGLMSTPQVVEAVAQKAVAYVADSQIEAGADQKYSMLARRFHGLASASAKTLRLGINPTSNGTPSFLINLGTITSG